MTEPLRDFQPADDIEALIRSARDYVRPSDELRPRVLEAARFEHCERRLQRRVWLAAVLLLLLATRMNVGLDSHESITSSGLSALQSLRIVSRPDATPVTSDPAWDMVESFTQLRQRQAELLRL